MDLRVLGRSYEAIADELGYYDASGAKKAVDRALVRRAAEQQDDRAMLRQRELDLIDHCIRGLAAGIHSGVPRAIEVALKASERRARLLGLDEPVRADVRVTDELTAQVMQLADELAEQADQAAAERDT
ncbi:hypothetical protein B4N89_02390 [Embleya scabrispora]|uniref:Uncharacterized protein n=1 Tax=Embleya scabrispora TaxID=159449 RepID=A0A1T3NT27_9ACTN|nr:hypothetical protein B4N89_02390 [Embleya scabrispora]